MATDDSDRSPVGVRVGDVDARVEDYMTRDVATVDPTTTVGTVANRIAESDAHNGFPVCKPASRRVVGFVNARDLLGVDPGAEIRSVMSEDLLVAHPEMGVSDAGRVILRSGIQKLPVVDDEGDLVGIISNADVIRSQIERATPETVGKLGRTLSSIHDVDVTTERRAVPIADLVPTQETVFADELEGRAYELQRGLAEPLVVVDAGGGELFLADGHHRARAADRLGIERIEAYVVCTAEPVDLGMARTAARKGLASVADVQVVDYAAHPLVESIERFQ